MFEALKFFHVSPFMRNQGQIEAWKVYRIASECALMEIMEFTREGKILFIRNCTNKYENRAKCVECTLVHFPTLH